MPGLFWTMMKLALNFSASTAVLVYVVGVGGGVKSIGTQRLVQARPAC